MWTWTTRWAKARDLPRSRNGGPAMSGSGTRLRCARLLAIMRSRSATTPLSLHQNSDSYETETRHVCRDARPLMPLIGTEHQLPFRIDCLLCVVVLRGAPGLCIPADLPPSILGLEPVGA